MRKRGRLADDDFDDYYSARAPRMRRLAYLVTHDWHAAEDVVQSAFVKVYLRWSRLDGGTLEAYVRRAVINESISHARRHGRESPRSELPDRVEDDDPAETDLDLIALLGALPAGQRAVVALRYLDDLSVAEVAQVLGVSTGTVKSQSARAMDSLRSGILASRAPRT